MTVSGPSDLLDALDRLERQRVPRQGGQRRFQRLLVRGEAELHPVGPTRLDRTPLEISLRDISLGGLGFVSQIPLDPGSIWRVDFIHRGYVVAQQCALIRYCRGVGDGLFLNGAQFCINVAMLPALGVDPEQLTDDDGELALEDVGEVDILPG